MDISKLSLFITTAEAGSLTLAARRLGFQVSNFLEAAEIAAKTSLVVLLPALTALPLLQAKKLQIVLPKAEPPKVSVSLVQTTRTRGVAVIKELGSLLVKEIQRVEALLSNLKKVR